jgi:hypothetical protein
MVSIIYKPECPYADEHGNVTREELEYWKYMQVAHLQYTIGNRPVRFSIISDNMDATRHMANGKVYDSKSAFRKATKNAGCIEVGNEKSTVFKPKKEIKLDKRQRRDDIKKAIYQLKNGRNLRKEF